MKTTAAALMMSVVGLCAVPAQAGNGDHIDEMANLLRRQTAGAANEIRFHFRNSPQYRHLYNDVYEMYQLADHVHEIAHHTGDVVHLQNDMNELDQLFHHVEELLAQMKAYNYPYPTYGPHFGNGGFQVQIGRFAPQNYHLDRLCRQLEQIGDTLHHLEADIESLGPVYDDHNHFPVQPPVVVPNNPGNPAGDWNWRPARRNGGIGISFSIR